MFNLNNTLLYGTFSDDATSIRTKNNKFVGKFVDGKRIIDYFPIDCKYVYEAADRIALLYNDRLTGSQFDNVFLQPFLIHGLLGGLQIFNDGNTRMGRIMQHALMWQLINERTKFNFDMPVVYATRSYYPFRHKYRDNITKLVTDGSNYVWNDWFDFNLDRIEDSIYAGRENVKTLKRKLNYKNF
jgi:Fic family protein